jgi:hypothetical protein
MLVTDLTRSRLHFRRTVRRWRAEGFEEIGEGGGRLWEIYRGGRMGQRITAARVAPDGMSVYVKIGSANEQKGKSHAD